MSDDLDLHQVLADVESEEAALDAAVAQIPAPAPEAIKPWERQVGEPPRAYHGFQHFRDLKVHSIMEAYKAHRRECLRVPVDQVTVAPVYWRVWSSQWSWQDRMAAWEAEVDRHIRAKLIASQIEARERHARLAQAMLTVLSLPVKAALDAARDPDFVGKLTASAATVAGANALIQQVARISGVLPGIVTMERLALGLTTESLQLETDIHASVSFADRIAADPAATELAIQLLDKLADPRPSLALGTGVPSEPGQVADSAASEPADEKIGGP